MPTLPCDLTGMNYRKTEGYVAALADRATVRLVREPDNKFDKNAVQVHHEGIFVGYIAKRHNRKLSAAMDADAAKEWYGIITNPGAKIPSILIEMPEPPAPAAA